MDLTGVITQINETQAFGANNFLSRTFVISTSEQYPQKLLIEFVQDKTLLLDNFTEGQEVKISINLLGREWVNPEGETKHFTTIRGWKIEPRQ